MPIQAVLFDLWGTLIVDSERLWRPRQAWRSEHVRAFLAGHGVEVELSAVDAALTAAASALNRLHDGGRETGPKGRALLFADRLGATALESLAPSALDQLEDVIGGLTAELSPDPAPGALDLVRRVKAEGMQTALVCNAGLTTAPALRSMLARLGFAGFLDLMLFSDEIQLAKPDPRIFQRALTGLRVEAAAALFVGDSPLHDIAGAQKAGIHTIQIAHGPPPPTGHAADQSVRPDAHITNLDAVADLIARLG